MITKLRLHNWKSFEDSTIYIDPLTFLIGTNASGKSNVLDAFDFLRLDETKANAIAADNINRVFILDPVPNNMRQYSKVSLIMWYVMTKEIAISNYLKRKKIWQS